MLGEAFTINENPYKQQNVPYLSISCSTTVGRGRIQMTPHRVNVSLVKQKCDIFTILRSRTQTEYSDIYPLWTAHGLPDWFISH